MVLERTDRDGVTVLKVAGPAVIGTDNAGEFESALVDTAGPSQVVVLDASGIDFFESDGVDALLRLHQVLKRRRAVFVVTGLNKAMIDAFRLAGLDVQIDLYSGIDQAVRGAVRLASGLERWH